MSNRIRSTARMDQINAAVAQTRTTVAAALRITEPPTKGTSPLFEELWDRHVADPRCKHLQAQPVQPSYLIAAERRWRCGACLKGSPPTRLDPVENYTCDLCRRYIPDGALGPCVVRQDMWVVTLGLCAPCLVAVAAMGGRVSP